jgi:hypothetical protein
VSDTDKIYLDGDDGMAARLSRAPHTLRQWIREGCLPSHLLPEREGGRKKIFWREDQVEALRQFADEREQRRGWQPAQ